MTMKHMKGLKCPVCQEGRILNVPEGTDTRKISLYPPEQSHLAEWFVKCPVCKRQIGAATRK